MNRPRVPTLGRLAVVPAAAGVVLAASVLPAAAGPTCSDVDFLDVEVHGQHVVRDYVVGASLDWPPAGSVGSAIAGGGVAVRGGPGPGFHHPNGVAPGASFCNSHAGSPGFHVPE